MERKRALKVLLLVGVVLVLLGGAGRDCMAILGLTVEGGSTAGAVLVITHVVSGVGFLLLVVSWWKVGGDILDYLFKK